MFLFLYKLIGFNARLPMIFTLYYYIKCPFIRPYTTCL